MYTSCPECGTVFRISTSELRMAEGYARCGHCSATFNAITTLTDEPPPTVTLQQLVLPTEPEPGALLGPPPSPPPPPPPPPPQ
ncbi:MAG: zinc-ribbon domain-containing protein, partial [Gammaproteobacteria bacterium]|nr:zinc-ribbon domain-containing protein [Gammaproteobacteria bacterium]